MANARRLLLARAVHTIIYVVMAASTFVILYAGVTGAKGLWLWLALGLLGVETCVFVGGGMKCPLTGIVARYAGEVPVSDTFFPERLTRHTLKVFGPLMALGVLLVSARGCLAT